jgi:hypothetical protein
MILACRDGARERSGTPVCAWHWQSPMGIVHIAVISGADLDIVVPSSHSSRSNLALCLTRNETWVLAKRHSDFSQIESGACAILNLSSL